MKLFFTDLDSTLLNDQKQISENLKQGLRKMLANGNKFIITSGRPLQSIIELKDSFDLGTNDGVFISANNGALIYDCANQKIIHREYISLELAKKVMAIANKHNVHTHTYDDVDMISTVFDDEVLFYENKIKLPARIVENLDDAIPLKIVPKVMTVCLNDFDRFIPLNKELKATFSDELITFFSCPQYLEVTSSKAGKGSSVRFICNLLGASLDDAYAIGDEENDMSMILAAGTGIAMKNAIPAIIEAADYVTTTNNNEDGALEALQKFNFL